MAIALYAIKAILAGAIILSLLILIHELGHFLVAKAFGIRVLAFSLGFGNPIWRKKIGDTEYRLCALPFGGYVQMAGEDPEGPRTAAGDEFTSKPKWQRACVLIAGPLSNMLFAFVTFWAVYMIGIQQPMYLDSTYIGAVAPGSSAEKTGILPGDTIVSINGKPVKNWGDIQDMLSLQDPVYSLIVKRDMTRLSFSLSIEKPKGASIDADFSGGIYPGAPALIGKVLPGSAADMAGLRDGDIVESIDSVAVRSWAQMSLIISAFDTAHAALLFAVKHGDSVRSHSVRPKYSANEKRFLAGISAATPPTRSLRFGPIEALGKAAYRTWDTATMIFSVLKKLIVKEVSPQQLAGPIGIIQMSGAMATMGLISFLTFMAILGVNLAIFNLLPLVITDGGVLFFLLLEAVRGKPLPIKAQLIINRIVISLLILLAAYVTMNDITRVPEIFHLFGK